MGEKVGKKLGEKMGEKTGEKVGESLGEIHKLNLCHKYIFLVTKTTVFDICSIVFFLNFR